MTRGQFRAGSPTRSASSRSPGPGRSSTRWRRQRREAAALFSAAIDPWKCTGCLECIDVCGPHALVERQQDAPLLETLQARFEFLSRTPNTPARFIDGATMPDGDAKRLMLDRNNYYATTGGHGACRGCGEVTAIRLVTGANHADPRQAAQGAYPRGGAPDRATEREAADREGRRARSEAARTHRRRPSRPWKRGSICSKAAREAMARPAP